MTRLNGWRRIGVVLTASWLVGCAAIIFYEAHSDEQVVKGGLFVWHALPIGTTVSIENGEVTLPDGKTIKITDSDRTIQPWEINWAKYRDIPTMYVYDDKIKSALAFPFIAWVLIEIIVAVVRWIARGFRAGRAA